MNKNAFTQQLSQKGRVTNIGKSTCGYSRPGTGHTVRSLTASEKRAQQEFIRKAWGL
jgi:hypothetical protein